MKVAHEMRRGTASISITVLPGVVGELKQVWYLRKQKWKKPKKVSLGMVSDLKIKPTTGGNQLGSGSASGMMQSGVHL